MLHMATSILSVPVLSFHSILQCSFLLPVKLTLSTLAYCISSTRDRCLILFPFYGFDPRMVKYPSQSAGQPGFRAVQWVLQSLN